MHTNVSLAFLNKALPNPFWANDLFDKWVASKIEKRDDFKVFIGWASISLHSIRAAKEKGKVVFLERGSSHIQYQNRILQEEHKKFDIDFSIDKRVINKELQEYKEADYIIIPSNFVKDSFLEYGINESKLFVNNYGIRHSFTFQKSINKPEKFIILYLGTLMIRKGLIYLFEAIQNLNIPKEDFEFWIIGSVRPEIKDFLENYKEFNWKLFGHIDHYKLPNYINQCDVAVHPAIEEGFV